jgi:hypothetical protein
MLSRGRDRAAADRPREVERPRDPPPIERLERRVVRLSAYERGALRDVEREREWDRERDPPPSIRAARALSSRAAERCPRAI